MGISTLLPPIETKTVVVCLLWYLVLSITSQLTKVILIQFPYPLFLGLCQFLIGGTLSLSFVNVLRQWPELALHFPPGTVPTANLSLPTFNKSMLFTILPLGLFQFVGKFFLLSATSLIPVATSSSIKALSPLLIVAAYRVIYNVRFPFITYLSLAPLVGGVILIIASDSANRISLSNEDNEIDLRHVKGLVFCIISTFIFIAQNIYGKQVMTWDATSPASLVLNTDPSRPGTPALGGPERKDDFVLGNDLVRQRNSLARLPYSTSDLQLEELKENYNRSPYVQEAMESNHQTKNPFAYFKDKLDLETVAKPDKLTILLYTSSIGFVFSFWGFLGNELPPILGAIHSDEAHLSSKEFILVMVLIVLDSLSHFVQAMLAFHLLGLIPALLYSIASMMKRIVLIAVSIVLAIGTIPSEADADKWFGKITTEQVFGLVLISIGLYCYDRWGSRGLKGRS